MNNEQFNKRLEELTKQIVTLPKSEQDQWRAMAKATGQRHNMWEQKVVELQENMSNLRIAIQYMTFDLEATKRENKILKDRLEKYGDGGHTV